MLYAKALKRAVVKALKGRTKQELACEDVEAQAESDKMESEVLVTVEVKWRGFRPPESPLQAVCDMDEVNCLLFVTKFLQLFIFLGLQRQDSWKRVTSKSKISRLGKDGRSLREYGT